MIDLKCPDCGANLSFEDGSRKMYFCQYCGAKIVLQDTVVNNYKDSVVNNYSGGANYGADELFNAWRNGILIGEDNKNACYEFCEHFYLDERYPIINFNYTVWQRRDFNPNDSYRSEIDVKVFERIRKQSEIVRDSNIDSELKAKLLSLLEKEVSILEDNNEKARKRVRDAIIAKEEEERKKEEKRQQYLKDEEIKAIEEKEKKILKFFVTTVIIVILLVACTQSYGGW